MQIREPVYSTQAVSGYGPIQSRNIRLITLSPGNSEQPLWLKCEGLPRKGAKHVTKTVPHLQRLSHRNPTTTLQSRF